MAKVEYACPCGIKTEDEVKEAKSAFCPKCDNPYAIRHNTRHYERNA